MIDELLETITDEVLRHAFGTATLGRARPYARPGSLVGAEVVEEHADGFDARARVRGTSPTPYVVQLTHRLGAQRTQLRTTCTCPVRMQCKHGAALALALRGDRSATRLPTWADQLAGALAHADLAAQTDDADDDPEDHDGPRQLALQLHLTLPPATGGRRTTLSPGLRMRPMRQGARRRWIKSGAGWPELRTGTGLRDHAGEQVDAVQQLAVLLAGPALRTERPYLHEFGPSVWRRLGEAVACGVQLQLVRPLAGIELLAEPVDLAVDLTRVEQGIGVSIGVAVDVAVDGAGDVAPQWYAGRQVLTVGQPAHGLVLLRERPGRALTGPMPTDVVLAPLARPAPAAVVALLRREQAVVVPPADWERFEADELPRLRRGFDLGSRDASVALPAPVVPRLRLEVTWVTAARAELAWSWRYEGATRVAQCALDSADRLGGVRDRGAERTVLAQLAARHDLGVPPARSHVEGHDALRLGEEVLPALRDGGLVEVVETDRPDFREAQGAPQISFTADAATADPGAAATDWLDLQVAITVDGESVALPLVLSALTLGLPRIILPSGLHLPSDSPELLALRDLVESAGQVRDGTREGVSVGTGDLGLWAQLADLGIVDAQAAEWVRRAQALRDLTELPAPEPVGVVSALRGYQLEGFRWLAFLHQHGLGGVLADDMGLGKTLQVLAMISHARAHGAGPFLVVAPTSVVSAWESEAARHTPGLRVRAVTASATRRTTSIAELAAEADVVVTTYTLLRLEADDYVALTWGGLVLDEAQQVKNHQAKTYQAVRRIGAPFALAVTGTPFENRLMELWSLLSITVPGLYPWPQAFLEQVAVPVEKEGDVAALRRFRARIRPFLLRRTKELVASDLPPKQEQVVSVQLDPRHRRVYDTHLQRERQKVLGLVGDFDSNRVAIFSSLTRLRQLSLAAALVDPDHAELGSAKIDTLVERLQEVVAEGHRALVFSQFTSFLALVRDRLDAEGIASSYLDGSTRHRGRVVADFKEGADPVFLISLKAGGVGLTLTEADYVFVLDPWWNPATEAQAVDRAHRIGQQRPVLVYRLVSEGTIEEKVMALKARKAALFAQVVDGEGGFGADITADDIRGLFD